MAQDEQRNAPFPPNLKASTGALFTTCTSENGAPGHSNGKESNCFQRCLLSPDSSTVVTYSQDRITRSFIVPTDTDPQSSSSQDWTPYASSRPIQSNATAIYPWYNIHDPSTTVLLQGHAGLPIRLVNTLELSHTHASYPWVNEATEAWITPSSLTFTRDGTQFVAGAKERIATFDLGRDGQGPVMDSRTRVSVRTRKQYGESHMPLSGLVSALAISTNGVLAAGTTGRQIGLWDGDGTGQQVSTFSIAEEPKHSALGGSGIMQLRWSSCGTYLFIAERSSDALLVYDMRIGKRLCWMEGRRAQTVQRLGFDIDEGGNAGIDLWAGGCDGIVRSWKDVTSYEGAVSPTESFRAHGDVVSSTIIQQAERLLVTTSGQRLDPQDAVGDGVGSPKGVKGLDNSMRIWNI